MDIAMTSSSNTMQGSTQQRGWFSVTDPQQEKGKRPDEPSRGGNSFGRLGFWLRLLLLMFLINLFFYGPFLFSLLSSQSPTIDLSYSRFLQQVEQSNVSSVTIKSDNSITGTFKTPVRVQQAGGAQGLVSATRFTTFVPATGDSNLLPLLEKKSVEIRAQPAQDTISYFV